MDTTKEYIKQVGCPEIQELSPDDSEHEWYVCCSNHEILHEDCGYYYGCRGASIWLPRQDQLQEMVFESRVVGFTKWNKPGLQSICTTIEQFSKSEVGIGITINGCIVMKL